MLLRLAATLRPLLPRSFPKLLVFASRPRLRVRIWELKLQQAGGGLSERRVPGLQKASARAERVGLLALARRSLKAQRLFNSGACAQANFGNTAQGAAPSSVLKMRTLAVRCCRPAGSRPCATTLFGARGAHVARGAVSPPNR